MSPADGVWRPLGLLLLMLGLGLRLDSPWQGLAWVLIVAGGVMGGVGLWRLAQRRAREGAFFPSPGKG